jgi:hypothetical protein
MRRRARPGADGWLGLAASPTFALMGLMTALHDDQALALCSEAGHSSSLGGMAAMYLLMAVFHLAPWLRIGSRS